MIYYRRKLIFLQDCLFSPHLKIYAHYYQSRGGELQPQTCQWYTGSMQPNSTSGYREIAHTADWELEVWAPNLVNLLEQAALGMYHLTGVQLAPGPGISRQFTLQVIEPETLLIDFLNELLYLAESEDLGFNHFNLQIDNDRLLSELVGTQIISMDKEIKAATYHKLNIVETNQRLFANIVFDV